MLGCDLCHCGDLCDKCGICVVLGRQPPEVDPGLGDGIGDDDLDDGIDDDIINDGLDDYDVIDDGINGEGELRYDMLWARNQRKIKYAGAKMERAS
jgi:hypothetical protein